MKKIILIKFLILSILTFSFTREEKIQNSLQKLGINQEIINETVKADYDARDIVAFQTDEVVIGQMLQRFSNILKKDERNYIASENIITIYESKIGKDYKNYLDLFVKYTPYDFEKTFAKMVYERSYGSQKKYDKYYSQLKEKYKNTPILEMIKIYTTKDKTQRQAQIKKVLNLLKDENVKKELGLADEDIHSMNLTYTLVEARKYYNSGQIEKAVSEYIQNIVNSNVSDNIRKYNERKETLLFLNILMINEEIKNSALKKENLKKLENTFIAKKIKLETAKDRDYLEKYLEGTEFEKNSENLEEIFENNNMI
ncbi:hypothetical protein J5A73_08455 [Leptotrichia sp. oral taxon 218]|jgi:hypothetical protein|uniref:hypothetical protein n=1 Tax=Leptotrichia sp. oral taxon 218 TaxID=712361 RepID=UPI001B8B41A4|nr:hypothetical protein [Leptotrichia sp. oral taxon 218]QUB95034.1 hypothetical protein J5A73_08455 [Leptotrichia sp. oral taxon 218]